MSSITGWSAPAEHVEHMAGLVIEPENVFTGAPPDAIAVEILIRHPRLDRDGNLVIEQGNPVFDFEPTGMGTYRTLSGRTVVPALDRRVPPPTAGVIWVLRLDITAPGLIPLPIDLDRNFSTAATAPELMKVRLLPAPDYLFPAHVMVLRGVVLGHTSDAPILVRTQPESSPEQTLTSHRYAGRVATTGAPLSFGIGLRSGQRPTTIAALDAVTGQVLATVPPPADPGDLITIQL